MSASDDGHWTRHVSRALTLRLPAQALPNWLAEMQITNLDVSFCKACKIDVVSQMTSLQVLSLQVNVLLCIFFSIRTSLIGVWPHVHVVNGRDGRQSDAVHNGLSWSCCRVWHCMLERQHEQAFEARQGTL